MNSSKPKTRQAVVVSPRRRVLIVHGDPAQSQRIARILEGAGRLAYTRSDADAALPTIYDEPPDMLIVDHDVPPCGGPALAAELKRDNLFAHIPILMTASPSAFGPQSNWADCPIDDFLPTPLDEQALITRVELCFARCGRELDANPLTRLPGNNSIIREIERRLATNDPFAVAYVDLDNFKSYNDRYGFSRGDEALRLAARLIVNAVRASPASGSFVGHVGGDDFVFVTHVNDVDRACQAIIQSFDLVIRSLYDEEDRVRGYIESINRKGRRERFPIMTLSIAVASNADGRLTHYGQVSSIIAEIKTFLKKTPKSNYLVERRSLASPVQRRAARRRKSPRAES